MNLNCQDAKDRNKQKALKISQQIISNGTFSIEELRLLLKYLRCIENSVIKSDAFRIIQGIDSQTDHFPLKEICTQYSQSYLNTIESEMQECIETFKKSMIQACEELVTLFSKKH